MGGGSRSRRSSSRVEREYVQAVEDRSSRGATESERRLDKRTETGHEFRDGWVDASHSSRHRGRDGGRRRERAYMDGYSHRYQPNRDHPHNNQYSARYWYGRRDPYTGRFVEASDDGRDASPSGAKGFIDYLKDALGGYGPDKSASAREAYKQKASSNSGRRKNKYYGEVSPSRGNDRDDYDDDGDDSASWRDWSERKAYREGFVDGYGENKAYRHNKAGGPDRRGRTPDPDDMPSTSYATYSRVGGDAGRSGYSSGRRERSNGRSGNGKEDNSDVRGDTSDRRERSSRGDGDNGNAAWTPAGGYGDYCGRRCCDPCKTPPPEPPKCCWSKNPTTYSSAGGRWASSQGYGRPRSCSLKAGGPGPGERGYEDEDYDEERGRRRRGRPRATSATASTSRSGPEYRDRSGFRRTTEQPPSTRRLRSQTAGRNAYVPPTDMISDLDYVSMQFDSDEDRGMVVDSDCSDDDEIRVPPFLEGRVEPKEFASLMYTERLMRGCLETAAADEDFQFYDRMLDFGPGKSWAGKGSTKYERGNMYCSSPGGEATAWTRTARQAHALLQCLTRDSLRDSVMASNIRTSTAVLFALDAAMRIAAIRHAGSSALAPRTNPLPDVLRRLPSDDAKLLVGGPMNHARGATAGILRGSYGSMIYWPHMRELTFMTRHCRYAAYTCFRCEVYMASRACQAQTSMTDFDLDAVSECFSAGLVVAATALQFLYESMARTLHPGVANKVYDSLMDVERFLRTPMGSENVKRAEAVCLGYLDEKGDVSVGVAGCVVGAYVAMRSSMAEAMMEYSDSDDNKDISIQCVFALILLLQRLMGFLNRLVSYMVISALYHGRDVKIRSAALKIYDYLCANCAPLYRPVTVAEFDDDREKAMKDIGCVEARGDPPSDQRNTLSPIFSSELDAVRLAEYKSYDALGARVPLSEALDEAREVIFGSDAVEVAKAQATGSRSRGLSLGNKRYKQY